MTTKKEAEQNVRLWLDALENGNLKQSTGALEVVNSDYDHQTHTSIEGVSEGFCCLGVACKTLGAKRVFNDGTITYDGEEGLLPHTIRKKLALKDTDPKLSVARDYDGTVLERVLTKEELAQDDHGAANLSTLNDDDLLTFKEIAKQIRIHKNEIFRFKNMDI